jgi:hypothetical protein
VACRRSEGQEARSAEFGGSGPLTKPSVQERLSDQPEVDHVVLARWIVGILRFPVYRWQCVPAACHSEKYVGAGLHETRPASGVGLESGGGRAVHTLNRVPTASGWDSPETWDKLGLPSHRPRTADAASVPRGLLAPYARRRHAHVRECAGRTSLRRHPAATGITAKLVNAPLKRRSRSSASTYHALRRPARMQTRHSHASGHADTRTDLAVGSGHGV